MKTHPQYGTITVSGGEGSANLVFNGSHIGTIVITAPNSSAVYDMDIVNHKDYKQWELPNDDKDPGDVRVNPLEYMYGNATLYLRNATNGDYEYYVISKS